MTPLTRKHTFDEVFDSQQVYRLLLTAFANPSRLVSIRAYADKLFGQQPEMLALAFTLLDNEVSFAVYGCDNLSDDIAFLTLSSQDSAQNADYIFVTEAAQMEAAVTAAKCGTLRDPHKSATLIVKNSGDPTVPLDLSGSGIPGTVRIMGTNTVNAAITLRDAQNYEYPQEIGRASCRERV